MSSSDGWILCEGERFAARLYKPATLRLSHPLTPYARPHPRDGGSHPAADSPPKHSRPIKRTRVPRSQFSPLVPGENGDHPRSVANSYLAANDEVIAGISRYECIPQVLGPENFRVRSRSLIDYLAICWESKCPMGHVKWISLYKDMIDSFSHAILCALNEKCILVLGTLSLTKKISQRIK